MPRLAGQDGGAAGLFLMLPLTFYGFAVLYPAGSTLVTSLTDWNGLGLWHWVGLANYVELFTEDRNFLRALRNTAIWTGLFVPISTALGLLLAVLLNSRIPARTVFRVLLYLPFVLSNIAIGLIWKWVYYPDLGALDLAFQGLGVAPPGWLSDPAIALYGVVVAAIWQGTGGAMVIFLAGLQTIPGELYEAASLDGAGRAALFRHIILPGVRESSLVVLSLAFIGSLNVFDVIYATTQGGPVNSTQVLGTWMYFQSFQFGHFGVGSAIASILLLLVSLIAVPFLVRVARTRHA